MSVHPGFYQSHRHKLDEMFSQQPVHLGKEETDAGLIFLERFVEVVHHRQDEVDEQQGKLRKRVVEQFHDAFTLPGFSTPS